MRPGSLNTLQQEVYYRKAARLYKQGGTIPLILGGGIRSYGVAKKLVRDGKAEATWTSHLRAWEKIMVPPNAI